MKFREGKNYKYVFNTLDNGDVCAVLFASVKGSHCKMEALYSKEVFESYPESFVKEMLRRDLMSFIEYEIFGDDK